MVSLGLVDSVRTLIDKLTIDHTQGNEHVDMPTHHTVASVLLDVMALLHVMLKALCRIVREALQVSSSTD